ncbi:MULTISPECIES: HD-GYP domain-containing protein [unclassified Candidatus Frackibacter]|uniref:HD-GYP domain-containing protein n=1 Tax=unclassified Candidatus Frackibacter TaxID=2648818 RepID=UPI00088DE89D|nr:MULTISPECIES: HD-GYP domain-containing protein [unclassified Candidatus Frackibacter]SDC47449.1 HD domain-containing protein [Candidatus Frackibacter sp. WG11]SEM81246.1 HD domain-containing protein [Candidatus Frackibacter sp. WG12]SFL72801.1 HD domain-containing protein [Candidatus Frackibacter sp. WG13]
MSKLSLEEFINKKFNIIFISLLIVLLTVSGFVFYTFYNIEYQREKQAIRSSMKYFINNLTGQVTKIERKYNGALKKQLMEFYNSYNKINNVSDFKKEIRDVKQNIKSINSQGIELDKVNYYLINSQGIITKTDYEVDLGLNLSKFGGLWDRIKQLKVGEVLLLPFDRENSTGRLRLYSYVRLSDNSILEIGVRFKNYDQLIKGKLQRFANGYEADIYWFSYAFHPLFKESIKLTEKEKDVLREALNKNRLIAKNDSFFETAYYSGWNTDYGAQYIKMEVTYLRFKNILAIFSLLFLMVMATLYLLKRNLSSLLETNFINPINQISMKMNSFNPEEEVEAKIEESEIKEIDQIGKSYTDMVSEISASYQQLKSYSQEITFLNEELEDSLKEVSVLNERFINMIEIISSLTTDLYQEEEFLSKLLEVAADIIPEVDYGRVCLFKDGKCLFVDAIGHDASLLRELEINEELLLNCDHEGIYHLEECILVNSRKISKEDRSILRTALKPSKEVICIDIIINSNVAGKMTFAIAEGSSKSFDNKAKKFLKSFSNLASAFFYWQRYNRIRGEFNKEFITSLTNVLEIHDVYTKGHSKNVAELGAKIARKMELSDEEIDDTYWAGMLHDIGKLLVPLEILNKNGSLTEEEYEKVKNHPYWGYLSLKDSEFLKEVGEYVLYHHERWDGKGYPEGLKGEEIPLISQVLTVADAWDAMTSKRAYRGPLTRDEAIQEIKDNKGTEFSPKVVDIFLRILDNEF